MSEKIAILTKGLYKEFNLPSSRGNSMKDYFIHPFTKKNASSSDQSVLRDINFEVKEGEFFGIVGRNGSGKSTLLKLMAGIYQPSKGSIDIHGRLVPFIELGVGFNPELTGKDNVYLNGALMGFSEREVDAKYKQIVAFAELERFMGQKLKNYSSGMQVRLAFSVATILAESDILLIDEVLAVGDADFQTKCFSYFKKLKKDKKTVVFVSHDMNAIQEYCDKVALIDNGVVKMVGKSAEVAKEYNKLFIGSLSDNERVIENAKNHAESSNKKQEKWGIGGVDILKIETGKKTYGEEDKKIICRFDIKPDLDFHDEIIPGITIKNEKGESVCGTNTDILGLGRYNTDRGVYTITWEIPNIFNEGQYFIDPAIISGSTRQTLQWWNDAVTFKVINQESSPYQVGPKITATF